jgi:hypothetical protein
MAGVVLLATTLLPYASLKSVVDSLAVDGQVESYTLARDRQLRPLTAGLGLAFLVIGGLGLAMRQQSQQLLIRLSTWSGKIIHRLGRDSRSLIIDLGGYFKDKIFLIALAAITLTGAIVRYIFLALPISYDEAYTFVVFAMRPLQFIVSDYHVPNNHIFHTILVRAAYLLLGADLWAIRLPVFIAGILLIPLVYLAGRVFFDRYTALLSAALVAGSSILIENSANARGYMLICLFSILLLILAVYLKAHANLAAWVLFILTSMLGFYTVPVFLYPFGMVLSWFILSILAGDLAGERWPMIRSLLTACLVAGALTLLLYLPIIRSSGFEAITGNRFVSSADQAVFVESIAGRFRASWMEWQRDLPQLAGPLMFLGLGIATIFNHRLSTQRIPFLIPATGWIVMVLAIQKVTPWPRVWLFLLPFLFIWTAGGLIGLARLVLRPQEVPQTYPSKIRPGQWIYAGAVICLTFLLSLNVARAQIPIQSSEHHEQAIAEFLKSFLEPGDVVAAAIPVNYPLRYYFVLNNIPLDIFFNIKNNAQFHRAVVIVDGGQEQTLTQVLANTRLDEVLKSTETAQLVHQQQTAQVYVFQH